MSESRKDDQAHVATTGDAQDSRTASPAGGASHTPGPWEWRGDDYDLVNPDLYLRWVDGGYKESDWPFVLQGEWHNDSSAGIHVHGEANARLIAAAPDLLESLREFTALYGPSTMDICAPGMRALVQRAEAAILKASGH